MAGTALPIFSLTLLLVHLLSLSLERSSPRRKAEAPLCREEQAC